MNHVFRTIWSSALGTWVVASELATQRGKSGGADTGPRPADAVVGCAARTHGPWPLRLVVLAALLALYAPAQAADRYWDANSNATGMGGTGTWDLTTRTWDDGTVHDGVAGPYLSGWNNAALDTAVFMGTAGTVSLGAPIVVGGLTFNIGGYTISGNTLTLGGATPTITATSGISTISSVIAGSAGVTKTGAGELDLTGANTFTGTVAVNQGTLYVANDAALGAAGNAITAASGTVLSAGAELGSRVVTLTGTGQTTVYSGFLSSRLTGTGGVSSNGSPTNVLNNYTGRTTISTSGSISFGSVANLGQASAFGAPTDPTLGTIDLRVGQGSGSNQFSKAISYTGAAATSNRNWSITPGIYGGAQVTFANNGSGTLNLTGNFQLTAIGGSSSANTVTFSAITGDMFLSGVISSGSARTVGFGASAGRTLALGNANTFTGTASVTGGGMVNVGTLANSGTASSLGAGSNISIGGNLSYTGGAASIDRTIAGAGGTFRNDGTGAFTLAGATTLNTGLWLGGNHAGSDNTLSGAVSGAGFLGSSGPATWVVTGNNAGFTGTLNVSGGTLRAGSATAFGSTIGGVTLSGGTLDLNGFSQTTSNLSGTGGTLALGAGNLTVDSATNTSFGGSIAGAGGLTKLGIGTLTLTGANTYAGATTIGGGTLALDFSNASAPASNIISSASTLNLQGGTLRVAGAASEANTQAFNGLNVLSSNNTLNVAPGTGGSMQVNLGAVTYSGGLLNFASTGTFGSAGTARITTTHADGTLGGWATINGTDYAKVVGGYIVPFTSSDYVYKDNAANWVDGEILSDGGDTGLATTAYYGTVSGTRQVGGLQYVATQNSTVNIGSGDTLGVDGTIVVSSSVGAATQTITGGSLTGVTGGGTLGIAKNGTGAFTVASAIIDNGGATGFAKSGTGTVVLSGANTYTGATTISQGTLSVSSIGNGGAASGIGASSADPSNLLLQGAALRYTGIGDSTDRGFTLSTNGSVTDNTVEVTNAGANLRFDGQVVSPDGANLIAKGPGTLTLGNTANTYSGTTTIDGGTLAVTELGNGGTASSIGTSSSASSSLVMKNGGKLAYLGGTASSDRGFLLNTSGGIDVTNGATTLTMSGVVAGSLAGGTGGAFTKTGAGTLVLSGTNTYSGGTTVSAGTLRAGSADAFGSGPIAVNGGATLDIADIADVRAGGLSGTGTLNLGVLSSTRYLIDGNSSVFGGIISGAGGVTLGSGTQTFSGCQHTYAGPTTIWGTLNISCLPNGGVASDIGASGADPGNLVLSGGTLNYQGGTTTTDRGFTLTAGSTISVQNPATTLTFSGQATGGAGLVKSGSGTLVLGGTTNNYTGGTTVSAGILRAGATNAFGTATTAGGMTVANAAGAILDMNGFDTTVSALDGGGSTGGEIRLTDKTLTIRTGGGVNAWDFAGVISGTGNLVKNGASNQYLSGCGSTYTGTTTINAGVLSVDCLANGGTASAIGASDSTAGNLVLNGGTLAYTGAGGSTNRQFTLGGSAAIDASGTGAIAFTSTAPITLTGTAARTLTLTGTNTGSNSLSALIADSGTGATSLSKTGTGTWILMNSGSTYTGVTTITGGGVLGVDKLADGGLASSIGASGNAATNLVIGTGSTLRYTGAGDSSNRRFTLLSGSTFIESSGSGPINLSNTGTVSLAGATAGASGSGLAHVVNLGGTNTNTNIFGATLTDAGTGKTTLSKNGTGLWVLTGNSTFTGDSIINQGNLMVGNGGTSGNVGAGNVYVTNPDSTLSVNRSDSFTLAGTLIGAGTLAQVGPGTTILTSTGSNIGNTTVSAGTLQVNGALTTATLAMSGTSALTVNGTVQASGPAPTALTGDAGASTLNVNIGATLRASGDLGAGADTLNLAGTLGTGAGTLGLGTGNDTLVLNDGGTIAGVVDGGSGGESGAGDTLQVNNTAGRTLDGAGTGGFETLVKQGAGTLTLSGAQSYSAGTTVQAGTLLVNGNQAGPGGPTTVQSGATLGGTGTVAGDVSVASGAVLSPGSTGAVGALTINGNLSLNSGSALNYQFGQANVPGGPLNDLTTVHGNLTLGGTLNVNPSSGGSFTPGVYRVINYDGALTDNGLTIGSAPAGTYSVQTAVANQVNLVNSTGVTLNFWDGPGNQNDGTIQGGNGLWQNAAGSDS
ncbi:autotransporter-associated beta strand repeat-containing protein [Variovorax sp. DT-64]|uniref:autotransporter-associated beta strand repeat-containing protein n=1 Tax=Variovorax sp. DT-64 TaxID=3396160 RepID=UPI003F1DC384